MRILESESVVSRPGLRLTVLLVQRFRWCIVLCLAVITAMLVIWNKPNPAYAIRFKSSKGDLLATGSIQLNSRLPRSGEVKVRYQLKFTKVFKDREDTKWLYSILGGAENGDAVWGVEQNQSGQRHSLLDFTPDVVDAKIWAAVDDLSESKLAGTWHYELLAGGFTGGTVELEKVK